MSRAVEASEEEGELVRSIGRSATFQEDRRGVRAREESRARGTESETYLLSHLVFRSQFGYLLRRTKSNEEFSRRDLDERPGMNDVQYEARIGVERFQGYLRHLRDR